jgi:predicted transcriptional regulator of viral defense system
MNRLTRQFFDKAPSGLFSSRDVSVLLPGGDNSRHALIKRTIAQGEIVNIRRGLYCLAPEYRKQPINQYAIAQQVYGPSYVSLESALSYHNWIPEAVYAFTSVSLKNSKDFETPLGLFTYKRVPQNIFYAGVERFIDKSGNVFLMAAPIKALADYVYIHRRDWAGLEPVVKSLRVEPQELAGLSAECLRLLSDNYRSRRIQTFIKGLQRDLSL